MILVTGASGFVGATILRMCRDVVACPSLKGKGAEEIQRIVSESEVDTIIHTAAIADTSVCRANPEQSYIANVQLPVYLAQIAQKSNIKLVCFSSDQVYTATKEEGPFLETMAKPGNIYAEHKLEMEKRVLSIVPDAVMLRAEWMYDYYLKKSNYFMNILNAKEKLRFSSAVYRGVTYVKEVAENMEKVIGLPGGIYNFGSETNKSMYEITRAFLASIGKDIPLEDAPPSYNLWMDCSKARQYGVHFSSVEDGLKRCAADYGMLVTPNGNI